MGPLKSYHNKDSILWFYNTFDINLVYYTEAAKHLKSCKLL